jgi:hypothetical protein
MKTSILVLVFVLTSSLTKLGFAELATESWCFRCPVGTVLTLFERDRYYCMIPGTNRSSAVPIWAKPLWAKVIWDVQEGRCIDGYTRSGDFCYQCPEGYAFTNAVTEYVTSSLPNLTGHWICTKHCPAGGEGKTARIAQEESRLHFTNEGGGKSEGRLENPNTVIATQWGNLRGDIKGGGTSIHWSNGTVWVRR